MYLLCRAKGTTEHIRENISLYILVDPPSTQQSMGSGICWDALHSGLSMDMICAWQGCELKESSMNTDTDSGIFVCPSCPITPSLCCFCPWEELGGAHCRQNLWVNWEV